MNNLDFEYLGPYHIQKLIGRGGMGSVYQAIHAKSGEPVAIKVIATAIANQPRFRRRFAAEIDALKRLKHPNIVSLVGYGEEQGILFYSMEYVEGQSLHDILRAQGRLRWQDVVHVGIETTSALKHAHDIGIIHRDLKPANLLIDGSGKIKLTDFGIAKLFGSADETAVGSVIGTADYMPPEQAEGKPVTVRSDLYSLGCVLYSLLAGKPPFGGKSVPEVLYAVRYSSVPEITSSDEIPPELVELVFQLLDKDQQKRPPTALVVGNRLKAVQQALKSKSTLTANTKQPPASPQGRAPQTSQSVLAKRLTSLDMEDDVKLTKEEISELVSKDSATRPSENTHEQPTLVASPSLLKRSMLTGKEDPRESELSGEHLSSGPETRRSPTGSTNPSAITGAPPSHYVAVEPSTSTSYALATNSAHEDHGWDRTQWASIAAMLVALVGSIGVVWWKLQPRSIEDLYAEIVSASESGDDARLLATSDLVDEFLSRFPGDERSVEVQALKDEADLIRRVKLLQRKAARQGGALELTAVEQAFLDAVQARTNDFQLGQQKLAALVQVFKPEGLSTSDARLVELAAFAKSTSSTVNLSRDPVAKAQLDELIQIAERSMTQEKLSSLYKNVLLLYADKPWAKDQVARIRKKLDTESTIDN